MTRNASERLSARLRAAGVAWLVAYPTITALVLVLDPLTSSWPLPARTLLQSLLMVLVLSLAVPPMARRIPAPISIVPPPVDYVGSAGASTDTCSKQ